MKNLGKSPKQSGRKVRGASFFTTAVRSRFLEISRNLSHSSFLVVFLATGSDKGNGENNKNFIYYKIY